MADATVTLIGNLTRDIEAGEGNRPARFGMAAYIRGSGDEKVTAFVNVKWFNPAADALDALTKGKRVIVVGRFDPWTNQDGKQVLDVMAEHVGQYLFTERTESNGNGQRRPPARRTAPAPAEGRYDYDERPF